ncbi:MAG: glycosyltransferase family 2 protein [Nitrospiria bacterium]
MKSLFPLVTIITPSFNQGNFVEETILSVLNQDYPNIEYIVVDGRSTDQTLEILRKYEGKLKWISEKDQGQADAVNKGFKMSQGEIIGWLNSDDLYEPGSIKKVVEYFNQNLDCLFVFSIGFQMNSGGSLKVPFKSSRVTFNKLSKKNPLLQPSIFFKKEILSKVGYLDIHYQYVMDYEYWVRIFKKYEQQTAYLPVYLSSWRLHQEAKTSNSRQKIYDEVFEVLKKYYGKVPSAWLVGYIGEIILGYSSSRGIIHFMFHQKWNLREGFKKLSIQFGFQLALVGFIRFIITGPFLVLAYLFRFLTGNLTRSLLINDKK